VVITIGTLIGHLIPLLPFVWLARTPALVLGVLPSALVLFGSAFTPPSRSSAIGEGAS
jgi:hypothetical protein